MFDPKTLPTLILSQYNGDKISIKEQPPQGYFLYEGEKIRWQWDHSGYAAHELYSAYDLAYGDILLSGIGLGGLLMWLSSKNEVKSITLLEKDQEMIDIFLSNNQPPKNIKIINDNVENYITEESFDFLILNHFEREKNETVINSVKKIIKNIPNHDYIWFWPIERVFYESAFEFDIEYMGLLIKKGDNVSYWFDFEESWNKFTQETLSFLKLPKLTKEKINEYIYTFCLKLDIQ
jgi:hypothetical protein